MKNNRRQLILFGAFLSGAIAWCVCRLMAHPTQVAPTGKLIRDATPNPGSTAAGADAKGIKREAGIWKSFLATPVTFYGKVIDESKNLVPGASVHASLTDHMYGGQTKLELTTDAAGVFHVSGHGLGIVVMVSKEGYYNDDASNGSFTYAFVGGEVNSHTDPDKPAIFFLRKKGKGERLIKAKKIVKFKKDGAPITLDLADGRLEGGQRASVTMEVWTNDNDVKPNSNQRFDWGCRLTVPGGGMIQRNGDYDFVAPVEGYLPSDEIDMLASAGSKWRKNVNRQYFLKFPGGGYGRIELDVIAGGDHFFVISSSVNPTPGSLNLEDGSGR